jgi:hypothetical protein
LIIAASAAAEMQSAVGGGFQILEKSFGGGENFGERTGIVSAKCSEYESDIRASCKCHIFQ